MLRHVPTREEAKLSDLERLMASLSLDANPQEKPFLLTLFADGSGSIRFNGSELNFGTFERMWFLLKKANDTGKLS